LKLINFIPQIQFNTQQKSLNKNEVTKLTKVQVDELEIRCLARLCCTTGTFRMHVKYCT